MHINILADRDQRRKTNLPQKAQIKSSKSVTFLPKLAGRGGSETIEQLLVK